MLAIGVSIGRVFKTVALRSETRRADEQMVLKNLSYLRVRLLESDLKYRDDAINRILTSPSPPSHCPFCGNKASAWTLTTDLPVMWTYNCQEGCNP